MSETFEGFPPLTYTQLPNELIDTFLPILGDAEVRVVLFVARKTYGWHRESDNLSLSQIAKATGLSKQSVIDATASLVNRGLLIKTERGPNIPHNYRLNVQSSQPTRQDTKETSPATRRVAPQTSQVALQDTPQTSQATRHTKETKRNKQREIKIAASPPPAQLGDETIDATPSKPEAPANETPRQPEIKAIPPAAAAPPVSWDDIEAAPPEARGFVAPRGKSKDAIERALTLACVPSGNRQLIKALEGEIRHYGKVIRDGDLASAEDIMARCVGENAVFYTTYLAHDASGGLTTPPTPGTIAKWLWNFENMPSERYEKPAAPPPLKLYTPPPAPERTVRHLTPDERRALKRLALMPQEPSYAAG